ncbi:MAG TPA: ABC transporter ATP-binding protein [Candidatus Paceibacterota bacterium]|nr:ABC transporter ATP-binding protein [Verrucomicrobiota bacterium]HRY49402.1 ABC transporter ATP-binding protein [Candidatus Paceibacterota bacterium]HSA01047.1 ABC transporter ATP-binding protein [Candidatus Paceibacterota bacterium]
MIDLEGIRRTYIVGGSPVYALKETSLQIESGDYVSIMGPSGSGKSTLLHVLGCLDRPSGGSYRFADEEISRLTDDQLSRLRRHQIGFVFQFFHLVPRLTAAGNVELPMVFAGIPPEQRRQRVQKVLEVVGLSARAGHRPDQLSGGEQQRVAIARAVVMEPALLLADEPTGNLDSVSGREIVELMETMNRQGLTLVVVTHDPKVGDRARRRIRLSDGQVVSDASV